MPSDLKTAYSHLLPQHGHDRDPLSLSSSSSPAGPSSSTSPSASRTASPAPLPADDHFAYSTQLRRHEPDSIVDFTATAAQGALGDLKHHVQARFHQGGYEPVPPAPSSSSHDRDRDYLGGAAYYPPATHGSTGPGGHSHHPFAHTTSPLTPSAHFATQSIAQTLSALATSSSAGLDANKVPAIRELSGPNEFEVEAKEPTWKKFLGKFYEDPLILLLLASAAVSVVVGNYDDAASILAAIVIVVTGPSSSCALSLVYSSTSLTLCSSCSRVRARAALGKVARGAQQARPALLPPHPVRSSPSSPPPSLSLHPRLTLSHVLQERPQDYSARQLSRPGRPRHVPHGRPHPGRHPPHAGARPRDRRVGPHGRDQAGPQAHGRHHRARRRRRRLAHRRAQQRRVHGHARPERARRGRRRRDRRAERVWRRLQHDAGGASRALSLSLVLAVGL